MGDLICPDCGSTYIEPSRRRAPFDWLFLIAGRKPYRCLSCYKRYFLPPASDGAQAKINAFAAKYVRYAPILIFALIAVYYAVALYSPDRVIPLSLSLGGRGALVQIAWNRSSTAFREAQSASIDVNDGGLTTRIDVDKDLLQSGTVVYARKSDKVVVHMKVGATEEMAAFVAATTPGADNEAEAARSKLEEQAEEIRRLEQIVGRLDPVNNPPKDPGENSLRAESADRPKLEQKSAQIRRPAPAAALQREERETASKLPADAAARVPFVLPPREPKATAISSLTPPPNDGIAPTLIISPKLIGELAEPVAPPRPLASHPRTGTLIWTGRLSKNGIIRIDGDQPSTGSLTGHVPGFPVQVNVYPAELTSEGLRVYTADPKYPPDYSEAPSSRNGWNPTSYRQDPRRAHAIAVVEPPRPENGWKRLVLRGGASNLSVVLVEWGAIPTEASALAR